MNIILTGAAGFIGFHTTLALLKKKINVYGIDDLNPYYDVRLKKDRLAILKKYENFHFLKKKIEDKRIHSFFKKKDIDVIINLAAQAGVRHSLKNPYVYVESNVLGQVNMLELAKNVEAKKFIYASSSSVYGGNKKMPFSVSQRVDNPISLYAATKKSSELIAECYSHLFNIKCIGLRFFTVYGPWGRPDMATFIFTKNILEGKTIQIFNYGKMERDFTYIDDIVQGILGALKKNISNHKVYNLGNSNPEVLLEFVELIEKTLNKKAQKKLLPIQPGDVSKTFADITESKKDLKFSPKTKISEGIPKFISWYKDYYRVR
ncbi:MAG: NAD-dependent epimerase/dehydratase family protein [Alphaproteobacteria bacterium]